MTAAGVLTHRPGDGAQRTAIKTGDALGMETVLIDPVGLSGHPREIARIRSEIIEPALHQGRPALFVLDQVDLASHHVSSTLCSIIRNPGGRTPKAILALTAHVGETRATNIVADGLDRDPAEVLRFRTHDENARLVDAVLQAMSDEA